MKKDQLVFFCECISLLTNLPIMLYSQDTKKIDYRNGLDYMIDDDEQLNEKLAVKYLKEIFDADDPSPIKYYISDDMIGFGIVQDKSSDYIVYIGPCKLSQIDKKMAARMHGDVSENPKREEIDKLYDYLRSLPQIQPETMVWLLSFINISVNHEIFKPLSFFKGSPFFKADKLTNSLIIQRHEFEGRNENGEIVNSAENTLLNFVKNGDINGIKAYWSRQERIELPVYTSSLYNANRVNNLKNQFIEATAVTARAAIEVGLSANFAHTLKDSYIMRCENLSTVNDFVQLFPAMYMDFTKHVKEIRESSLGGNFIVKRAINFIFEHVTEKISAKEIAQSLKISPGYLSTIFKNTNGISIPEYIAVQKVKMAKELLANTDKTLTEISNYLSFSSQSYFQSQFKKVEGITPLEYRTNISSANKKNN